MSVPKSEWLSPEERRFLGEYLEDAIAFHLGELEPGNKAGAEFVEMLKGQRGPTRALEFLYLRFLGERGIGHIDPVSRLRQVLYCSKCNHKRGLNRVLWYPNTGLCVECGQGFLNGRRRKKPARKARRSKQPKPTISLPDSIPWAQRFAPTRPERPKLYQKGGFADYDYDSISPHGIPRKKRD